MKDLHTYYNSVNMHFSECDLDRKNIFTDEFTLDLVPPIHGHYNTNGTNFISLQHGFSFFKLKFYVNFKYLNDDFIDTYEYYPTILWERINYVFNLYKPSNFGLDESVNIVSNNPRNIKEFMNNHHLCYNIKSGLFEIVPGKE